LPSVDAVYHACDPAQRVFASSPFAHLRADSGWAKPGWAGLVEGREGQ
jgi:hypothetical protein